MLVNHYIGCMWYGMTLFDENGVENCWQWTFVFDVEDTDAVYFMHQAICETSPRASLLPPRRADICVMVSSDSAAAMVAAASRRSCQGAAAHGLGNRCRGSHRPRAPGDC